MQDNATKSNPDAVFNAVQPRTQAIEEMTMSTAAAGADSLGEGAVQIKFVTKGGTNQFHGGLYETNRNSYVRSLLRSSIACRAPRKTASISTNMASPSADRS